MLRSLLSRWAGIVHRHHLLVLALLVLLTAASALSFTKLELQVDVKALLPDDSKAVQANYELKESFGADLVVVVVHDSTGPVLRHADFVDHLSDRLEDSPLVEAVDASVYENVPTGQLLRWLPLLLEPEELEDLAAKVEPDAIRRRIRLDKLDLQGPMVPPALKRLLRDDPLLLVELLESRLASSRGGYSLNTDSGYYVSRDDSTVLVFAQPIHPSDDIPFAKELLAEVERIRDESLRAYRLDMGIPPDAEIPGLEFGVTGLHAIAATESRVLQRDTVRAVAWSLALVLLLFAAVFRRLDPILFVGLPLLAALTWTCAATYLVIGHLNLMSTGFAAIVLGLGVDYAIHVYNRWLDHRGDGDPPQRAIEAAVTETGAGTCIGAVTTAGAFLALTLYDFRGLREFGFIVAVGVLLSLVSMLTFLPALLALRERLWPEFHRRTLVPFGTRALVAAVASRPTPWLLASLIVTLVLGVAASQVGWQGRILGEDFSSNPALELRERLRKQFQSSPDSIRLLLRSDDLDALERIGRTAHQTLEALVESEMSGATLDSIFEYVQPPEQQRRTIERLREDPRFDSARIVETTRRALEENGFALRPFEPALATIGAAFSPERPLGLAEVVAAAHDGPFLERYVTGGDGRWTLSLNLGSGARGFTGEDVALVESALTAELPGFDEETGPVTSSLAGGKVLARELRERMREGYALVTFVALLLVLGVMWLSFRRLGRVALALTPLVLGVTWMLGIMTLTGVDMNVINVPVTAMILGIGIDDAVHVVHSFFHEAKRDVRATYRTTGKALVLTTLTTSAGFGSLAFAGHPGLRSMGLLAILGCVCCLAASLMTLPALLVRFAGGHVGEPAEDEAEAFGGGAHPDLETSGHESDEARSASEGQGA